MHNENELKEINERLDRIEHAITILIKYAIYGDPQVDSLKTAKQRFLSPKHKSIVNKAENISKDAGSEQAFIDAFIKT